jgi:hypothetical protein
MADWRQIQARIRKAKNSADAPAKLSELFQRTRDAMVAWELGALEEKAEHKDKAGNWYTIAAQRFRRSDWKKKAEEALTRLGREVPAPQEETKRADLVTENTASVSELHEESREGIAPLATGEISAADDDQAPSLAGETAANSGGVTDPAHRKRRRGRRGGRGRRRKGALPTSGLPTRAFAEAGESSPAVSPPPKASPALERPASISEPLASAKLTKSIETLPPKLPSERTAHGRAGEPALASRMAHLESMLRRLVASPFHRLDEAEDAPAGPGVFLLSDSDQITSYYVEACQTLRIGCANIARGGHGGKNSRSGRGFSDSGLKERLADYLGISEAKVSQYMKDHCVLRWIQLDEEAPLLAHFAIGVLRTPLNVD